MRNQPNIVARTRASLHLSQQDLASNAYLSRLQVIRFEQSIPPHLSPALSAYFTKHYDDAIDYVSTYSHERSIKINAFSDDLTSSDGYTAIKNQAIEYALDTFTPTIPIKGITVPYASDSDDLRVRHPFYLFRTYLFEHYGLPKSQIKFCEYTGVHPATISSIERGKISLGDSPTLKEILSSVLKLTNDDISLLEKMCDQCL